VQTRMLEGREEKGRTPEGVLKQQQKYSDFVQRNGQPFQAFLDKSGGPTCSCLNPVFGNYTVMPYVVLLCRFGLLQFRMAC